MVAEIDFGVFVIEKFFSVRESIGDGFGGILPKYRKNKFSTSSESLKSPMILTLYR
jgi:hypothetical protein